MLRSKERISKLRMSLQDMHTILNSLITPLEESIVMEGVSFTQVDIRLGSEEEDSDV